MQQLNERKVNTETAENELVDEIISVVKKHGLTINNINDIVQKACEYMENNATLERDYQNGDGSLIQISKNDNGIDRHRGQ